MMSHPFFSVLAAIVLILLVGAPLSPVLADDYFDTDLDINITRPPEIVITPKIVGGNEAPLGACRFFAHSTRGSLCGGALISSDIVLTAAHCTNAWLPNVNVDGVIIGSINRRYPTSGGVYRRIESVLKHPSYSSYSQRYDIMLVKLSQPVTTITPAQLNENSQIPSDYAPVTAVGFGATNEGGGITNTLMQVDVNIVPFSTCDAQYSSPIHNPSMVCAGVPGGGKDACQGDSGGPLLTPDNKIVGVVSFGVGCARASHAGVYARVSTVSTWIKNEVCNLSSNPPSYCNPAPPTKPPTFSPTSRPTTHNPASSPTETPEYVKVKLVMKYDNAPSQTSWEIHAQPSGREVFSGPIVPPQANSQVPYIWNLFPTGEYTISVYDTGFNGLALDSYFDIVQIHSDGTEVKLAEGTDDFLYSTTVAFTVYPDGEGFTTQAQSTTTTTITSTSTLSTTSTSTSTSSTTSSTVPSTTVQQPTTTSESPVSGGTEQQYERVKLTMKYDNSPTQTEWEIKDLATDSVLFDGPKGPPPQANSQVPYIWNLFPTGNYSITIYDYGFNGMQHDSYFTLVQLKQDGSEIVLAEGNQFFLFSMTIDFTVYPGGEAPIESATTTLSSVETTVSSSTSVVPTTTTTSSSLPQNTADLRLVLNYGADTVQRFWIIKKAGTIMLEGPVKTPTPFSEETLLLSSLELGQYEITIYDMSLDGSQDTFRVFQKLSNGEELLVAAGGGNFVEKESVTFVVSAAGTPFVTAMPSASPTSHPSSSPSSPLSQSPSSEVVTSTSATSTIVTSSTTPLIATTSTESTTTTLATTSTIISFGPPAPPSQATIRLTMKYDSNPEETSWSIVEGVNTALYTGPSETPEPNSIVVQDFLVPFGYCKFRVSDTAVNGMQYADFFRIDQIMSDGRIIPLAQSTFASFGLAMVQDFTVLPDTTTVKVKVQYANSNAPRQWEIYAADAEGNRGDLLFREVQQQPVPNSEKVFTLNDFPYGEYFATAIDTTPPSSGDVLTIYQEYGDGTEVEIATTGSAGFVYKITEEFALAPRIIVPTAESPSSSPIVSFNPTQSMAPSESPTSAPSNGPTAQVTIPQFARLKLTVRFDDSPGEVSWKIKRGYTEYLFFGPNSTPAANAEVVEYFDNFEYGDNYLLQFSDGGFNGIVRSDGKPFVTLSQMMPDGSERVLVESNQSFGYVLTLLFKVEP